TRERGNLGMKNEEPRTMNAAKSRLRLKPFMIAFVLTAGLFGMGAIYVWQTRVSIHAEVDKAKAELRRQQAAGEPGLKNVDIDNLPPTSLFLRITHNAQTGLDVADFLETYALPLAGIVFVFSLLGVYLIGRFFPWPNPEA